MPLPDLSVVFSGFTMHSVYALLQLHDNHREGRNENWIKNMLFDGAPRAYRFYVTMREFVFRNVDPEAQARIRAMNASLGILQ